jgi:diguanylate cyclase (GGDEF)-like protein
MSARRPVAVLLSLQAVALLLLTAAATATWWNERATVGAQVDSIQRRAREIRGQASVAALEPYAYGSDRDPKHIVAAEEAVAKARGLVDSLAQDMPAQAPAFVNMGGALADMTEVIAVMGRVSPTADLSGALAELTAARLELGASLSVVEDASAALSRDHFDRYMQINMLLWGGLLLTMLATGLAARRGAVANDLDVEREQRQVNRGLAEALDAAVEGKAAEEGGQLRPVESFRPVYDAVTRTIALLADLRAQNLKMQRRTSFLKDIQDALSMTETEDQVMSTAYRAANQAYPAADFAMLLVDPGKGRMAAHRDEQKRPCGVANPEQCPAVHKGRTLHHKGGDGPETLARCPHIREPGVSVSCAPVHVVGNPAAIAQLSRYQVDETGFDDLEALALAVASRLGVVRSLAERELEAGTDPLTGLCNRRILNDRLAGLDSANIPYTVVLCDLDHFKRLNDTYGHDVGDKCLVTFAEVLRRACRDSDVPCRLGGEEFVLLLPGANMKAGLSVALRIRTFLAEASARIQLPYTASIGVASKPDHGNSGEAVLRAADAAMYDAKEGGRDQVVPARALPLLEAAR